LELGEYSLELSDSVIEGLLNTVEKLNISLGTVEDLVSLLFKLLVSGGFLLESKFFIYSFEDTLCKIIFFIECF
jgi:hypothetical protein